MLPLAVGAILLGDWIFAVLVAVLAGIMFWEWQGFCGAGRGGRGAGWYAGIAVCASGPALLAVFGGLVAAVAGIVLTGLVGLFLLAERRAHKLFLVAGLGYIFFACIAMVWLRDLPDFGMATVIWLFAVVVTTDTAAYFTGKTLGGPKLAPRISPKKTWAGLIGGIVGAVIAGALVAGLVGGANIHSIAVTSGGMAIVAQTGDLLVSKAKRVFKVKDSSNLIPGHGGVLDRFDGFLLTSLFLAALSILRGGSPLTWL